MALINGVLLPTYTVLGTDAPAYGEATDGRNMGRFSMRNFLPLLPLPGVQPGICSMFVFFFSKTSLEKSGTDVNFDVDVEVDVDTDGWAMMPLSGRCSRFAGWNRCIESLGFCE